MQLGEAGNLAEGFAQYFRTQAGAAHAEQKNVGEPLFFDFLSYLAQVLAMGNLILGDTEPAQPAGFIGPGPE
jgi:hypothetical protein